MCHFSWPFWCRWKPLKSSFQETLNFLSYVSIFYELSSNLVFYSFRINRIESPIQPIEGDCGESLTLYDASWPDDSRIIKTFCDTFSKAMEKHDFVSTGSALFVRFESKTGSYSG